MQHTHRPFERKPQWPVAALPVPEPPEGEQLLEGADRPHDSHTPRLTVRQRHGKLFNKLDLSCLDSWTPKLVDAACRLLAEYHDMFSLDPMELGCTHSMEHTIKVTDDTPFKEWFRWIPPPLVKEVRSHLQEMLESGAIRPSQNAWCNAVAWHRRRMAAYGSVLTSAAWMLALKRTPTLCLEYRRVWRVW